MQIFIKYTFIGKCFLYKLKIIHGNKMMVGGFSTTITHIPITIYTLINLPVIFKYRIPIVNVPG